MTHPIRDASGVHVGLFRVRCVPAAGEVMWGMTRPGATAFESDAGQFGTACQAQAMADLLNRLHRPDVFNVVDENGIVVPRDAFLMDAFYTELTHSGLGLAQVECSSVPASR